MLLFFTIQIGLLIVKRLAPATKQTEVPQRASFAGLALPNEIFWPNIGSDQICWNRSSTFLAINLHSVHVRCPLITLAGVLNFHTYAAHVPGRFKHC